MIRKGEVKVYIDDYRNAHKRLPKGEGEWEFVCGMVSGIPFRYSGMFKEAKQKAVEFAALNGCRIVSLKA